MASTSKKRKTTFQKSYSVEFKGIKESSKGDTHAFCSICSVHFSICYGGKNDVKDHTSSIKHKSASEVTETCQSVSSFFVPKTDNSVIQAEVVFTQVLKSTF